jgi:hypothetical protein
MPSLVPAFLTLGASLSLLAAAAAAAPTAAIPDLSGQWIREGALPSTFEDPPGEPGPVVMDLNAPHNGSGFGPDGRTIGATPWIADLSNPILKPWVREVLKTNNALETAGEAPFTQHGTCNPSGVPQVLNLREPKTILQTSEQITIVYQRDMQVRRVYLNEQHPPSVRPSYYGHSVGHYEGDTLVVDTVALNDKTPTDRFGTPHTEQLHVVERYRLIAPDRLRVQFVVSDPGAFNMPWTGQATFKRSNDPILEVVCAENNRASAGERERPIPTSERPDF